MKCSINEIGIRIAGLRTDQGISQGDLAKQLNVSREVVAKWENGTRDLKTQHTVSLADYFGVTCDYILRGVPSEYLEIHKATGLSPEAISALMGWYLTQWYEDGGISRGRKKIPAPVEVSEMIAHRQFTYLVNQLMLLKKVSSDSFNKNNRLERNHVDKIDSIGSSNYWELIMQKSLNALREMFSSIAPVKEEEDVSAHASYGHRTEREFRAWLRDFRKEEAAANGQHNQTDE